MTSAAEPVASGRQPDIEVVVHRGHTFAIPPAKTGRPFGGASRGSQRRVLDARRTAVASVTNAMGLRSVIP